MQDDTCTWHDCHYKRWASRGYSICGVHAEFIYNALRPDEKTTRDLERQIRQLQALAVEQEKRIRVLKGPQPEPSPKPARALDGTVYILRCGGYIKIGWTSDLAKRMRAYQPDTALLATMPGTRKDENRLHKRFAHLRTHGREWYSLAPQITEYVGILVSRHGQPDPITFAAKPVQVPRPHSSARSTGETSTRLARAV